MQILPYLFHINSFLTRRFFGRTSGVLRELLLISGQFPKNSRRNAGGIPKEYGRIQSLSSNKIKNNRVFPLTKPGKIKASENEL